MTTTLHPVPANWPQGLSTVQGTGPDVLPPGPDAPRSRGAGLLARNPAWPITILLVGYPLWWALGIADFMWIVLAIPMISRMLAWRAHGSRPLRVPPGFGIWLLFLVCAVAGVLVLTLTAPGTVPSAVSHRVISYGDRTATYLGTTVLLVYVGNLTESELSRRRLAWMLGLVCIYAIIGGVGGMIMPHFQFSSPFQLMLPKSVQNNGFIQASMHPGLSQLQNVTGTSGIRPKAPFDYTNTWGECLTILIPWLLVGWKGTRRQRLIALAAIVIGFAPLLYSLNRGVWLGVALAMGYLGVRFAARGKIALLGGLIALVGLIGILVLATPLQGIVTARLSHGGSANLRSNLASLSVTDAIASPVIGYGDTRQERGSPSSITIGPSPKCPTCGQLEVGSTGQLWLLLVCSGFVGAAFYLGFFAYGIWRYRHDTTPYGLAGVLVLLLSFLYMFTYDAVGAPLGFTVLAYALLWKNDTVRRSLAGETQPAPKLPAGIPVSRRGEPTARLDSRIRQTQEQRQH